MPIYDSPSKTIYAENASVDLYPKIIFDDEIASRNVVMQIHIVIKTQLLCHVFRIHWP